MPWPVRISRSFFGQGFHETPIRGETLFLSGLTKPGDTPDEAGVTTETFVKPVAMSRFASRPYFSVSGAKYSYRAPMLIERFARNLMSSTRYALYTFPR